VVILRRRVPRIEEDKKEHNATDDRSDGGADYGNEAKIETC